MNGWHLWPWSTQRQCSKLESKCVWPSRRRVTTLSSQPSHCLILYCSLITKLKKPLAKRAFHCDGSTSPFPSVTASHKKHIVQHNWQKRRTITHTKVRKEIPSLPSKFLHQLSCRVCRQHDDLSKTEVSFTFSSSGSADSREGYVKVVRVLMAVVVVTAVAGRRRLEDHIKGLVGAQPIVPCRHGVARRLICHRPHVTP